MMMMDTISTMPSAPSSVVPSSSSSSTNNNNKSNTTCPNSKSSQKNSNTTNNNMKIIEIIRSKYGYGFTLSGEMPCRLTHVKGHARSGGLRSGDRLHAVNGQNVDSFTHDQVVELITSAPSGRLVLSVSPASATYVCSSSDSNEEEEEPETIKLESIQQPESSTSISSTESSSTCSDISCSPTPNNKTATRHHRIHHRHHHHHHHNHRHRSFHNHHHPHHHHNHHHHHHRRKRRHRSMVLSPTTVKSSSTRRTYHHHHHHHHHQNDLHSDGETSAPTPANLTEHFDGLWKRASCHSQPEKRERYFVSIDNLVTMMSNERDQSINEKKSNNSNNNGTDVDLMLHKHYRNRIKCQQPLDNHQQESGTIDLSKTNISTSPTKLEVKAEVHQIPPPSDTLPDDSKNNGKKSSGGKKSGKKKTNSTTSGISSVSPSSSSSSGGNSPSATGERTSINNLVGDNNKINQNGRKKMTQQSNDSGLILMKNYQNKINGDSHSQAIFRSIVNCHQIIRITELSIDYLEQIKNSLNSIQQQQQQQQKSFPILIAIYPCELFLCGLPSSMMINYRIRAEDILQCQLIQPMDTGSFVLVVRDTVEVAATGFLLKSDPKMAESHQNHENIAKKLSVRCTPDPIIVDHCLEFPESMEPILRIIFTLYRRHLKEQHTKQSINNHQWPDLIVTNDRHDNLTGTGDEKKEKELRFIKSMMSRMALTSTANGDGLHGELASSFGNGTGPGGGGGGGGRRQLPTIHVNGAQQHQDSVVDRPPSSCGATTSCDSFSFQQFQQHLHQQHRRKLVQEEHQEMESGAKNFSGSGNTDNINPPMLATVVNDDNNTKRQSVFGHDPNGNVAGNGGYGNGGNYHSIVPDRRNRQQENFYEKNLLLQSKCEMFKNDFISSSSSSCLIDPKNVLFSSNGFGSSPVVVPFRHTVYDFSNWSNHHRQSSVGTRNLPNQFYNHRQSSKQSEYSSKNSSSSEYFLTSNHVRLAAERIFINNQNRHFQRFQQTQPPKPEPEYSKTTMVDNQRISQTNTDSIEREMSILTIAEQSTASNTGGDGSETATEPCSSKEPQQPPGNDNHEDEKNPLNPKESKKNVDDSKIGETSASTVDVIGISSSTKSLATVPGVTTIIDADDEYGLWSMESPPQEYPVQLHSERPVDVGWVGGWASDFDILLSDPIGIKAFTDFLRKEFSYENLQFFLTVQDFKNLTNLDEIRKKAQEIYDKFIALSASDPINVDSKARKSVEIGLQNPNNRIFSLAEKQIYNLMKFDSYIRFLKSDIYEKCSMLDLKGKPLPYETGDNCDIIEDNIDEQQTGTLASNASSNVSISGSKISSSSSSTTTMAAKKRRSFIPWARIKHSIAHTNHKAASLSSMPPAASKEMIGSRKQYMMRKLTNSINFTKIRSKSLDEHLTNHVHKTGSEPPSHSASIDKTPPIPKSSNLNSSRSSLLVPNSIDSIDLVENNNVFQPPSPSEESLLKKNSDSLQPSTTATTGNSPTSPARSNTSFDHNCNRDNCHFLRIVFPDRSQTVVPCSPNETIENLLQKLIEKRSLKYLAWDVFITGNDKPLDPSTNSARLGCTELRVEQRILFQIEFPSQDIIGVKARPTKLCSEVLRPLLLRYGYRPEHTVMTIAETDTIVPASSPVSVIDGQRILVTYRDDLEEWGWDTTRNNIPVALSLSGKSYSADDGTAAGKRATDVVKHNLLNQQSSSASVPTVGIPTYHNIASIRQNRMDLGESPSPQLSPETSTPGDDTRSDEFFRDLIRSSHQVPSPAKDMPGGTSTYSAAYGIVRGTEQTPPQPAPRNLPESSSYRPYRASHHHPLRDLQNHRHFKSYQPSPLAFEPPVPPIQQRPPPPNPAPRLTQQNPGSSTIQFPANANVVDHRRQPITSSSTYETLTESSSSSIIPPEKPPLRRQNSDPPPLPPKSGGTSIEPPPPPLSTAPEPPPRPAPLSRRSHTIHQTGNEPPPPPPNTGDNNANSYV